jgi:hypothetical protein
MSFVGSSKDLRRRRRALSGRDDENDAREHGDDFKDEERECTARYNNRDSRDGG